MKGVIYQITNLKNNKFYIGSTNNFKIRKQKHLWDLKNNKHVNKHLQNSYNKYGENVFEFKILLECDNIKEKEQEFLDNLDFTKSYNISRNSVGGDIIKSFPIDKQIEIYKKLSDSMKGKTPINTIKINIEGIEYYSYNEASRKLNIPVVTIRYRCNSLNIKYKNWNIIGKEKNINEMYEEGQKVGHIIICENLEFSSYSKAAKYFNLSITALQNRVKSKNYPEYYKK